MKNLITNQDIEIGEAAMSSNRSLLEGHVYIRANNATPKSHRSSKTI